MKNKHERALQEKATEKPREDGTKISNFFGSGLAHGRFNAEDQNGGAVKMDQSELSGAKSPRLSFSA
jgi:hypothetical protein